MSRRRKADIVKEILELCKTPTIQTHIVYQCNLNFVIIKKYFNICFTNGWLQKEGDRYKTTTLGNDYLVMLIPVINEYNNLQF